MIEDGRIAVGVLGRPEKCTFYSIFIETLAELGYKFPEERSDHHLGEKETLIKLFEDNGFEVDYCWVTEILYDVYDEKDLENLVLGPLRHK